MKAAVSCPSLKFESPLVVPLNGFAVKSGGQFEAESQVPRVAVRRGCGYAGPAVPGVSSPASGRSQSTSAAQPHSVQQRWENTWV